MNRPVPGEGKEPESSGGLRSYGRKLRIGPSREGMGVWSPMPQLSSPTEDTVIVDEARQITRALVDQGPMSSRALQAAVASRYWGPRRFSRALHYALEHQMIRRLGRDTFAPPARAPGEKKEESEPPSE